MALVMGKHIFGINRRNKIDISAHFFICFGQAGNLVAQGVEIESAIWKEIGQRHIVAHTFFGDGGTYVHNLFAIGSGVEEALVVHYRIAVMDFSGFNTGVFQCPA